MPALGEILRRFRSHGVPGAPAAVVAVPADETSGLEAELAPVFAALEDAQRSAADAVTAAERDATDRRAAAVDEGQQIVARARSGVVAARDEAAAARLALAEAECREVLAAGGAEASRIDRVANERMDAVVERVVERVLAAARTAPAEQAHRP